jgi:hypothetical protein
VENVEEDHILEHLNYLRNLGEIVIAAIAEGKGTDNIDVP